MQETDEVEAGASLENFISFCVTTLLRWEDPEKFLVWLRDNAPTVFPEIFNQIIDPTMRPSAAYFFGRAIWNATPLPGNLFRPRTLPKPERNAPCVCGSGTKYKHCCGRTDIPPFHLEPALMLSLVLRNLTQKQLVNLPYRSIPHEGLALAAEQWLDEGKANRCIKLLEPIFTDPARLSEHDESAFDVLMDAYLQEGKSRKRVNLIEKMLQSGNRTLRVTAMQRHCTMLADAGDFAGAWELFEVAMREYPGQAAFSHLEVTLLISQGRVAEAKERAKFWAMTLRRQNNPEHDDLIEFLSEIVNRPTEAMFDMMAGRNPAFDRLAAMARELPEPAAHYSIDVADSMGALIADKLLVKLEKAWHRCFPLGKPFSTGALPADDRVWEANTANAWLAFLEKHPLAWQSFDILDDVLQAVWQMPVMTSVTEAPLIMTLQRYAVKLFGKVTQGSSVQLPWGVMENRPALRLLADYLMYGMGHGRQAEVLPLLEDMVLCINPDDNHGLRAVLVVAYLRSGQYEKALALCERYPHDILPEITFGKVLALYLLGRKGDALTTLIETHKDLPEVLPMLLADNPRQPKLSEFGVSFGGKDQAWYYRQDALMLWQGDALGWLREVAPAVRKTVRKSKR